MVATNFIEVYDLSLSTGETKWVEIRIIHDQFDLDKYVESQEEDIATPVTVATQRSLRIIEGSDIRLYIPNPPKKKIYKISFNAGDEDSELERGLFYDLLESFELIYTSN